MNEFEMLKLYIGMYAMDGNPYYIVLDEVQLVEEFVEVILSLTHMRNVYVSGSNSRFFVKRCRDRVSWQR